MNKFVEKVLDYWDAVPAAAKQVSYGFVAGFVLGLIL